MSLDVYFSFNGNCRKAMEFYAAVFGVKMPEQIMTYGQNRACQKFCVNGKVYHQNGTRSLPNSIANWLSAGPQC